MKLALFKLADAVLDRIIKACMRGQTWLDLHWPIHEDDIEEIINSAWENYHWDNSTHIPRRRK